MLCVGFMADRGIAEPVKFQQQNSCGLIITAVKSLVSSLLWFNSASGVQEADWVFEVAGCEGGI